MKRFSIGLVAVLMAIGFAAFTTPKQVVATTTTNNLYRYMPNALSPDPTDPAQYVYTANADNCTEGNDEICIISSPGSAATGAHPTFTKGNDPYNNLAESVSVVAERAAQ
ncbi:hypothetical protein [Ferruginibacter sp. SUN106]|uniref:hypothetical protein n=1 Tax=Ferruginibacter sp. SUN106 TaxID=2978348 RepID=UPI003D3646D6